VAIPAFDVAETGAAARKELGIPEQCSIVGMLARVSPQKDYFTLASAAAKVLNRFPHARFLVVGDNSLVDLNRRHFAEVEAKLNALGIADKFVFTGHRDDAERFVAAMDFCVLSTHREGFPLSILESMAMGKPVIATSVGGIPEIVLPAHNGYLCEHENSNDLAAKIEDLLSDPVKVKGLGDTAREHVRTNYSKAKYVAEILQAYSDVTRP
jgi:glycosyltransferase involved in cell wall biosynthesis